MNLTERRKQFLSGLIELYQSTRGPVHYETLAQTLGVSKWTAYDMLKELEKQGLLTRDYTVNAGEAGRSQVVFVPTAQAEAMFSQQRTTVLREDELAAIKRDVLQLLRQLNGVTPSEAIERIMRSIPGIEVRVTFCAYLMGILVIYLQTLDPETVSKIWRLTRTAPQAETQLTMLMGTVIGTSLQTVSVELVDLVGRFLREVNELTEPEKEMLVSFIDEGIADV